jgi:hypothetical protein
MDEFNDHKPPGFALVIFRCFCKADFREDIEGDLLERFEFDARRKGVRKAQLLLIKEVLLLIRPNLISKPSFHFNLHTMKSPQFIRLSIAGVLAIGSVCYIVSNNPHYSANTQSISPAPLNQSTGFMIETEPRLTISKPVSNKDWSDFLRFLESDATFSAEYVQSMLPDNWEKENDDCPVLGVSWLQAQEFCKWRSVLSTYTEANSEKVVFSEMVEKNLLSKKHITYRLPTESEWNALVKTRHKVDNAGFICVISEKG